MEVLNLIRLFVGLGFPLHIQGIQALHTAYTGEYLRFRYQYLKMFGEKHKYILYISAMYIWKSYRHWSFCIILPLVGPPQKKLPFSPWAQKKSLGSKHVWWHGIPVIIRDPRHSVRPKPPLFRVAKKKSQELQLKKTKGYPPVKLTFSPQKKTNCLEFQTCQNRGF